MLIVVAVAVNTAKSDIQYHNLVDLWVRVDFLSL